MPSLKLCASDLLELEHIYNANINDTSVLSDGELVYFQAHTNCWSTCSGSCSASCADNCSSSCEAKCSSNCDGGCTGVLLD